jgi:hypothetical protein
MSNIDKLDKPNKIVYVYDGENDEDDKYFEECCDVERKIFERFDKYLYVKIYVDSNDKNLLKKYDKYIRDHNRKILENVGFFLLSPIDMVTEPDKYNYTLWLDVKCVCQVILSDKNLYEDINIDVNSYKLQPIQGIETLKGVYRHIMPYDIDYIGNLKVEMDVSRVYDLNEEYTLVKKYRPVYELMNNEIDPVYVERVGTIEELYTTKVRL